MYKPQGSYIRSNHMIDANARSSSFFRIQVAEMSRVYLEIPQTSEGVTLTTVRPSTRTLKLKLPLSSAINVESPPV